jgi:hypothetical protein
MQRIDKFNFPAFDAAAKLGRDKGYRVYSPADHDRECGFDETKNSLEGFDMRRAQLWDIEAITKSDAIALLPGWEKSTGASVEATIANWLGLAFLDATTWEPFPTPVQLPRRDRTILLEAQNLVHGDRNKTYGDPSEDMGRTAGMWTSLFRKYLKDGAKFEARDVSLAMICVKLSRLTHSSKRDSWTDCAGYAETGSWIDEG